MDEKEKKDENIVVEEEESIIITEEKEPDKKEETPEEKKFRLTVKATEKLLNEDVYKNQWRLRLVREGNSYHIMQGMNLWGSLRIHRISIFRGSLKRILKEHAFTKRYYKDVE